MLACAGGGEHPHPGELNSLESCDVARRRMVVKAREAVLRWRCGKNHLYSVPAQERAIQLGANACERLLSVEINFARKVLFENEKSIDFVRVRCAV